jgi:hypothetical protein
MISDSHRIVDFDPRSSASPPVPKWTGTVSGIDGYRTSTHTVTAAVATKVERRSHTVTGLVVYVRAGRSGCDQFFDYPSTPLEISSG